MERARKLGDLVIRIHIFLTAQSIGESRRQLKDGLTKVVTLDERTSREGRTTLERVSALIARSRYSSV